LTTLFVGSVLLAGSVLNVNAGTITLKDRTINQNTDGTSYSFASQSTPVTASCNTTNCTRWTQVANFPTLVCPSTCTLYIHIESEAQLSAGDKGRFRFRVDGQKPDLGPTAADGSVVWLAGDPDAVTRYGTSYSVVARISGTGLHTVTVDIGCTDTGSGDCAVTSTHSSVEVDTYTP
jgi:hypothetical protein